jgi:hypothetical protein
MTLLEASHNLPDQTRSDKKIEFFREVLSRIHAYINKIYFFSGLSPHLDLFSA